jgi:hypothetical protein
MVSKPKSTEERSCSDYEKENEQFTVRPEPVPAADKFQPVSLWPD